MQDSNRITLLCVIMVNFKADSSIAEPMKLPTHPEVPLVSKIYIYSKYSVAFHVKDQHKGPVQQKKADKYFLWLLQIHI